MSGSLSSKSIPQLSSTSSHKYSQPPADRSTVQCTTTYRSNGIGPTTYSGPEFFQYIKDVLVLSGIDIKAPVLLANLHLDTSIFNYLEMSHSHFTHSCNRKLIFELVREISGDIFRPSANFKMWGFPKLNDIKICSSELIDKLCKKIRSFPEAICQVLEDIDQLIDGDLADIELQKLMDVEDEGVAIVEEIGVELMDMIVNEVAMEML